MIDNVAISLPEDGEGDSGLAIGDSEVDEPSAVEESAEEISDEWPEPEEEPIEWEKWSPDGNASFDRVSESNFDDGGWAQHLSYPKGGGMYPEHRFGKRVLPDGRIVLRPESFMGHDQVFDADSEPVYVNRRSVVVGYGND